MPLATLKNPQPFSLKKKDSESYYYFTILLRVLNGVSNEHSYLDRIFKAKIVRWTGGGGIERVCHGKSIFARVFSYLFCYVLWS